jgi:hypothetical protein
MRVGWVLSGALMACSAAGAQRIEVTVPGTQPLHGHLVLNNAVHLLQAQLDASSNPHSDATFQYGPGMPHCYTGGPVEYTMQQNNADWLQRILPQMVDHMVKTAPAGADTKSWNY